VLLFRGTCNCRTTDRGGENIFPFFAKEGREIVEIDNPSFATIILDTLKDDEYLDTQRRISKELVDGKGIDRIKRIILDG